MPATVPCAVGKIMNSVFSSFKDIREAFWSFTYLVDQLISMQETNFCKSLSPCKRLFITLRILATGESQKSLSILVPPQIFKRLPSTNFTSTNFTEYLEPNIISETCHAIYNVLWKTYLQPPSSADEWLAIAKDFKEQWNLLRVVGALYRKHIWIQCNPTSQLQGTFLPCVDSSLRCQLFFYLIDIDQHEINMEFKLKWSS